MEIAYELERLVMLQHGDHSIDELPWSDQATYREIAGEVRLELDAYYADRSLDVEGFTAELERSYSDAERCLEQRLPLPSYHKFLRCCEVLEILRARQTLGGLREQTWIERLVDLSRRCADARAQPEARGQS